MRYAVALLALVAIGCSSGGGEVFMKELGCCTWTESAGGNTMEYTFAKKTMSVNINNKMNMDYEIAKIIDSKRMFILYAKKSGKYVPIWWEAPEGGTVKLSQLVGTPASDNAGDAENTPRSEKFMTLSQK